MKGWYKTSDGTLHELYLTYIIDLHNMDVVELVIPDGVEEVHCDENKLTELIIPYSVERICCWGNNITELIVPDNCIVQRDPGCVVITRTMYNRSIKLKNLLK